MARPPTHISELLDEVSKVIETFISNEEQFTILDISEQVKKELAVSHQDVRIIAKPILDKLIVPILGFYEVQEIEVDTPNGKALAMLYLPDWTDPDNYTDRAKSASKPVVTSPAQPAAPAAAQACCNQTQPSCVKNADWSKVVTPRSDGKVAIPAEAFKQAGIGARAAIIVHPNSISLEDGAGPLTTELRISTADLRSANLLNKPVYVCAFKGRIVVCS